MALHVCIRICKSGSVSRVGGVMVSIVAFQAVDPGSTPGQRILFPCFEGYHCFPISYMYLSPELSQSVFFLLFLQAINEQAHSLPKQQPTG